MPRHERLNELAFHDAVITCLTDQMHIDKEILVIDGDFDAIPLFEIRQPLGLPHPHGHKSWLPFAGVDPCLSASHFLDRANENTVPEKQLGVSVFRA
jgi:hypothetical protein